MIRRLAGWVAIIWVLLPGVAAADPPGPTDYLSEVIDVDPPTSGIDIEIVGGDSFVLLSVDPGLRVDVVGYSGEPYLRFLPGGTVEENRLSPTKYQNEDRYAIAEIPAGASSEAEPVWVVVAEDGSFAWHDHRTHWMSSKPPPGRGPGDQITEGVVPLLVDGSEVDVTVASIWQEPPSPVPVAAGLLVGGVIGWLVIRRRIAVTPTILVIATAATAVGAAAVLSVPAETAPPWSLWVFPAIGAALAAVVFFGRARLQASTSRILLLIAALELVAWGVAHWSWLWPALLPTALPYWLDRFVAATTLVGAIGAAAAVLLAAAAPNSRNPMRG